MRKNIYVLCLFMIHFSVLAQQAVELAKLEYLTSGLSQISNSPYEVMNEISTENTTFVANLNYGHDIKRGASSMLYSLNYSHFFQNVDVSSVADAIALENIPSVYYQYPNLSQISLTSGIDFKLSRKWSASFLGSVNFTDDFYAPKLNPNFTWLGMAYVERKRDVGLSYGLGLFVNQLENRFLFAPSAKISIQNDKLGLEILFPEKARAWFVTKKKHYFEVGVNAKSLSIEYADKRLVRGLDIYTIKAGAGYSFLWQDFLKFKAGFDFPLIFNVVNTVTEDFEFLQHNGLGFNLSLSLMVSNE